jgi:hypothetical protein|tara:strand:- start:502 stop:1128 length:627 start_codon:yes stop_codon:yes gene_type:complete
MAKALDATFDPTQQWVPTQEGTYPAHVTSLTSKEVNTRAGEAIVVNMTYKVAPEVSEVTQPVWEMDGYNYKKDPQTGNKIPVFNGSGTQSEASCGHLKDKILYDNGFFVFTDTSSASKNSRYFQLLENLDIKCEDDKGIKKLVLIEEEDVVGKPVLVTTRRQEYVTKETRDLPTDQQEKRATFKVNTVTLWEDGDVLTQDELDDDVPF